MAAVHDAHRWRRAEPRHARLRGPDKPLLVIAPTVIRCGLVGDRSSPQRRKGGLMLSRRWSGMVVFVLVLGIAVAGCAKRPATTQASAPAPSGVSGGTGEATQPSAPPATQPSGPSTETPAPPAAPAPPPRPREVAAIAALREIHLDFDKYHIRPG